MGDVVNGNFRTTLPVSVEKVIEGAQVADLGEILILGWKKDEVTLFAATSNPKKADLLYLLELAKHAILQSE